VASCEAAGRAGLTCAEGDLSMEPRLGDLDCPLHNPDLVSARGAAAVEYGMLVALIAAVVIGTIVVLGPVVSELYERVQWW
jgi:hypothetical protein